MVANHRWTRKSLDNIAAYRPGKRVSEVRRELGLAEIVKLSSNECPFGPVPAAREAMVKGIPLLNRYPDGAFHLLKTKLAARLKVEPAGLMVGNGSNELLRLLAQCVLEPGDEAVMAAPSFIVYPIVVKLMEGEPVEVPLRDFTHDLEAMAAAVTGRTKLVFVCNPNNPTGTLVGGRALVDFIKGVPERVLVVVDEAYHEYVERDDYRSAVELVGNHPNVVVLRTFSKIYGLAGARVGYGTAHPSIVEAIDKVREPFNVNSLAQLGAYYSLGAEGEIERRRRYNREQKAVLYRALDELGLTYAPSETNFVYFNAGPPAAEAFAALQGQGVVVRAFGDGDFIRPTLGTAEENRRLIEGLKGLSKKLP
jgi:histidinol-phosphate aminotransferase